VGRVIVVGSANVDLVWHGLRLPRPGETVTDGTFSRVLGGKGANQAAAAAVLGADVVFVGSVGEDDDGDEVRADLEARGVDCTHLARSGEAATGVALVMVDARGDNVIAVAPGANRFVPPDVAPAVITRDDVVLCSCEVNLDAVENAVDAALRYGAIVIVNPAPARAAFAGAILTPNEQECEQLGGIEQLTAIAPAVVVTQGASGATLYRKQASPHHEPAWQIDAVDTTGAGDAFNAGLAWALANGNSIEQALRYACGVGAVAAGTVGARLPVPDETELPYTRRID
jgi:ribokinase